MEYDVPHFMHDHSDLGSFPLCAASQPPHPARECFHSTLYEHADAYLFFLYPFLRLVQPVHSFLLCSHLPPALRLWLLGHTLAPPDMRHRLDKHRLPVMLHFVDTRQYHRCPSVYPSYHQRSPPLHHINNSFHRLQNIKEKVRKIQQQ